MWRTCVSVIIAWINISGRGLYFVWSNNSFGQSPVRWTWLLREMPILCDITMVSGRARFGGFNSSGRSPYCVTNNKSGRARFGGNWLIRCPRLRCPRLDCPPACWFPIRVILTSYRFIPWPLWLMLKHCRPDILARGHLSLRLLLLLRVCVWVARSLYPWWGATLNREAYYTGSGQVKRTTIRSARPRVLREKPGSGEGNPSVTGAARLGSADILGDFRDSGGKPGLGELISTRQGPAREPD